MTLSPACLFRVIVSVLFVCLLNPEKAIAGQAFHNKAATVAAGLKPVGPLKGASNLNLTLSLPAAQQTRADKPPRPAL